MAHAFRSGAMALVDPLIEGLIRGTGRSDVAKIAMVIDQSIKATRIPRRMYRRLRGRFEERREQVFGDKTHH